MSQLENLLQQCTVKLTRPGRMSWGSGFFVAPEWILTCAHVVQEVKGEPVQVRWQKQENWEHAVVERLLPEPYDLALLRVPFPLDTSPPCVYLDEVIQSRDPLYLFGYPDQDFPNGCPVTFNCEGLTGDEPAFIKFAMGQVRPGMSGSPLLNQRTGKVCGMVKFTRGSSIDLGGGAVSTKVILAQFPELLEQQRSFHQSDKRWLRQMQPPRSSAVVYTISNVTDDDPLPTAPHPGKTLETRTVQPYLRSLIADKRYQQQWGFYTPTDAIDKLQEPKAAIGLDIGLMVQLLQPKRPEDVQNPEPPEEIVLLPVLEGLRKYAAEHVLLTGRPGSGKSTALVRLLLEEARQALANPSTKIPVLVELRYLDAEQPSVLERIGAFLRSHDLAVNETILKTALAEGRLLLLIDGVNELPSEAAQRVVARFQQDYPQTPMIFTTRDAATGGDAGLEKKLEMQPLGEQQMRRFVQAYLPEQGELMLQQLQGRLREMGRTPLLLWMLCEVFKGLHKLPSSLGLLFRWFVGEYDKLKHDVPVSAGLRYWKSELLQHLAFTMMQAEQPTELRVAIPRLEAETVLSEFLHGKVDYPTQRAKEWLEDLLEHHLIQHTNQMQLEFHHQLLQEYYAAEALLQRRPYISDEQMQRDYLNYLKWTEPLALMLALVEQEAQAVPIVKLALNVDWMLGARLAGEVQPGFQGKTVACVTQLPIPPALKVQLLYKTHSEFAVAGLLNALEDQNADVEISQLKDELFKVTHSDSGNSTAFQVRDGVSQTPSKANAEEISSLLQRLSDKNAFIRWNAAQQLGNIGTEAATPALLQALSDENYSVRGSAAQALGKIGTEAAIPALLQALSDKHYWVRGSAAQALGRIDTEAAIPALLQTWPDKNNFVHRSVAQALGKIGTEAAIPALLQASSDKDNFVRRSAAQGLGRIGTEVAINTLLQALSDEDNSVRAITTQALRKTGGSQLLPCLSELLLTVTSNQIQDVVSVILTIQQRCKYYNYALYEFSEQKLFS